jgi:hypothetical protein
VIFVKSKIIGDLSDRFLYWEYFHCQDGFQLAARWRNIENTAVRCVNAFTILKGSEVKTNLIFLLLTVVFAFQSNAIAAGENSIPVRAITQGPKYHWFGYPGLTMLSRLEWWICSIMTVG